MNFSGKTFSKYHLNEWQFKRLRMALRDSTSPKSFPWNQFVFVFSFVTRIFRLLLNHVDAYNKISCNHPSKLQLNASNFDHEHHLYLFRLSCYTDDLAEIYVRLESTEQTRDYHHTSKHETIFRDFHLPKPTQFIRVCFSKYRTFLTSISSSKKNAI